MPFSFPDISKNQLFNAGLGLLGAGIGSGGRVNPFQAGMQGFQAGTAMDEKAEAKRKQDELQAAYVSLLTPRPTVQQPPMTQEVSGPAMRDPLGQGHQTGFPGLRGRPVGTQQPQPAGQTQNLILAGMPPQAAGLLAQLPPQQGIPFLLDRMSQKPSERRIVKAADGFNYYADSGERVIPGAKAAAPKKTSVQLNAEAQGFVPGTRPYNDYINKVTTQAKTKIDINQGAGLSKGQEEVDKKYAAEYADFVLGGQFADAQKGVDQLRGVVDDLEGGEDLTGTLSARLLPEGARAVVDPKSLDAQQLVEEVVQRNLRLVLGAQFTEREGERLIARAYNPALKPEANARRLRRLFSAMERGLKARTEAAEYFEENGTMRGYRGTRQVTQRDLEDALGKDEPVSRETGGAFTDMPATELLEMDTTDMSPAELDDYIKALDAIGG